MFYTFFILITLVLNPIILGFSIQTRIIGGNIAKEGQFPYQASIRLKDKHQCGGSIFNEKYILTAAHCLFGFNKTDFSVTVGSIYLSKGYSTHNVTKIILHPRYHPLRMTNDIALMEVENGFTYNEVIQPIKLGPEIPDNANIKGVAVGWGTDSTVLHYLNVTTATWFECAVNYVELSNYDAHICTKSLMPKGLCLGDSGGPLIVNNQIIGIVSFGKGCAERFPSVFTRISWYKEWLENTVEMQNI